MINNNEIYKDAITEVQRVLKLERPYRPAQTRSEELAQQVRVGNSPIIEIRSESERLFVGFYYQAWINSQCGGFAPTVQNWKDRKDLWMSLSVSQTAMASLVALDRVAPRLLGKVRSDDDTPGMRFNAARGGSKE